MKSVVFFFRKPSPVYHSIENLFDAIIENITSYKTQKHYSPWQSKGLTNRYRIAIDAKKNQSEINHITGDIHFIALLLKKSNTILTIHDIGVLDQGNLIKRKIIQLFWFSWPIRRVKYVTVISEFTKQELVKKFKVNPEKIFVINNCISDCYQYAQPENSNTKPVLLQIGTKPNKNLERVINAISSIDCKLAIVGKLSDNQQQLLKSAMVDYTNYLNISQKAMLELYENCDLLLFASTYEGFGLPIVEANAVGRPVLTSNLEPMKSVAGDAALLVNPFDLEEIKEGIVTLLNDGNKREKLIHSGLENAKKYRASSIAKEYEKVYNKLK